MRPLAVGMATVVVAAGLLVVTVVRPASSAPPLVDSPARPHAATASLQVTNPPGQQGAGSQGAGHQGAGSQAGAAQAAKKAVRLGIISYNLPAFEQQTKLRPSITAKYFGWGTPFPRAQITADHKVGATTLVVLEPQKQNLKKLAGGKYDAYLKRWAAADKKLDLPLILSFAPEANGNWYPWGKGHISAALYRKLYQHVHDVLLKDGAQHVTWLWQVDRSSPRTEALAPLFPGKAYVSEIGLDGQLSVNFPTFVREFGPTLRQVRAFTKLPVLLSEVGIEPGSTAPKKIDDLFGSARRQSLTALVLFDVGRWNFDSNLAALKAIRTQVRTHK